MARSVRHGNRESARCPNHGAAAPSACRVRLSPPGHPANAFPAQEPVGHLFSYAAFPFQESRYYTQIEPRQYVTAVLPWLVFTCCSEAAEAGAGRRAREAMNATGSAPGTALATRGFFACPSPSVIVKGRNTQSTFAVRKLLKALTRACARAERPVTSVCTVSSAMDAPSGCAACLIRVCWGAANPPLQQSLRFGKLAMAYPPRSLQ